MTTTTDCYHESIDFDRQYGRYQDVLTGTCEDCGVHVTLEKDEDPDGVTWELFTEGDAQYDAAVEDALIEREAN